ncbi:MAG: tetratricopeptide repeat protein, partial [Planctomycetota bacterium]|nr:tetratricopeptide repeat protein [Planctomycetota bacterium]
AGESKQIGKSRMSRWRAAALLLVHLLIALHIAQWLATGTTLSPVEPSEAMEFSKHGIINAGFIFFALAILGTLLLGRFVCGWACHLVALQDLCRYLLVRLGLRPRPLRSRLLVFVPLLAFGYMFLWPLIYRLWIGDALGLRETQLVKEDFWATMPSWPVGLVTLAVCGFAVIYILGSKGFCAYACPYGAIFGVADRLAPGRIRVTDACDGSGACTAACTSDVLVHREVADFGMVVDPGCMKCLDCVSVCPNDALYFGFGRPALLAEPRREPKKRRARFAPWEEALLGLLFLGAFLTFRGLYGLIPFLLTLGWAAILAALGILTVRLLREPDAKLAPFALKRGGRLRPAGRIYLGFMVLLCSFWAHSAAVRFHEWRLDSFHAQRAGLRTAYMESGGKLGTATLEELQPALERAVSSSAFLAAWALRVTPTERLAGSWARALAGRGEGLAVELSHLVEQPGAPLDALWALAELRRNAGLGTEAAELYGLVLSRDGGHLAAGVGLGRLLAGAGDLPGALDAFDASLVFHPDNTVLLFNRGTALALAGNGQGAEASYRRVLELDPDFNQARENLAGLLCGQGRLQEGLALYQQALGQTDDEAGVLFFMAMARARGGDLAGAERELLRVLELQPDHGDARRLLEEVRRLAGSLGALPAQGAPGAGAGPP